MNVADKINYLLEEKGISKREFAQKLLSLNPLLDRTGKAPSESTIYGYLNGGREIKIELIPYIAEALNVSEQELFTNEIEFINDYNFKYSKESREILDLLKFAPRGAIDEIKNYLLKYKKIYDDGIKWDYNLLIIISITSCASKSSTLYVNSLLSSFIAFTPYFALTEKLILFRPIKLYLNYNERFGFWWYCRTK